MKETVGENQEAYEWLLFFKLLLNIIFKNFKYNLLIFKNYFFLKRFFIFYNKT